MELIERFRGCLLGLAVGDALGTAVEFSPRGSFPPVEDILGGGPFRLRPGEWTDDTSMALCLACSLVETGRFDPLDQMERYTRWYHEGYMSSNGRCFDIGNTVHRALVKFEKTGEPFSGSSDPLSAGNGSIMRLAPIAMAYFPDPTLIWHYSAESSRTTHAASECLDACRLLGDILLRALLGQPKEQVLIPTDPQRFSCQSIQSIAEGHYFDKDVTQIKGSGYVVQSLEAALWCFWKTDSYQDAVLQAANLGDDADTTAAVCGQVAGAYYGEDGIPASWSKRIAMYEQIKGLADKLHAFSHDREHTSNA